MRASLISRPQIVHVTLMDEAPVLFHITQVHTAESCPKDEGGSNSLFNPDVPGLKLIGRYGANAQHTLFYIVETSDVNAIQKFLWPGFKRCTATVTPVSEVPVPKDCLRRPEIAAHSAGKRGPRGAPEPR